MTAKEDKLKSKKTFQETQPGLSLLMGAAESAIRFFLGAVLAGAELSGGYAMCGIALIAASGPGTEGFAALLGACFGYLCFQGFLGGLRYIAACVLAFAVAFAFWDVPICRRSWFMPTAAAAINGAVGFIYLSEGGWQPLQAVYFSTEVVLTAVMTYFYRLAFSAWEDPREENGLSVRQTVGVLVLGCTLLMTLSQVHVLEEFSLGRILAVLLVMLAGWQGGVGTGTAVGVAAGLAMDLAAGTAPCYTMPYGFAGLICGVFWKQGRLMTALAYVISNAAAVLWMWQRGPLIGLLYEVFIASVIFLLLPERLLRRLSALVRQDGVVDSAQRAREYAARHLSATASAFRELEAGLRELFRTTTTTRSDKMRIFDRAADRVCAHCSLREICWTRDYQSTRAALNDTTPILLDRGRGSPADYPAWFAARCVEIKAFSAAVNEELAASLVRRQYQARIKESRGAVCRQYEQLAGALEKASKELKQELPVDPVRQRRVQQRLAALGLEGESAVYYDEYGHLRVEIAGAKLTVLDTPEERGKLSQILGVPLRQEESPERGSVCLVQSEPLMAVVGVAAREKEGQKVSGDAGAWFKDEAGRLHIFLCDGMGSGPEAREESTHAVTLLEKFLRAGVEPAQALRILNSALALRWEERGGFTTIDLLRLDLFTGEGALYKLGAAPTYVRHEKKTVKLMGQSLPAGLTTQGGGEPDELPIKLGAGDWLVMASDGVTSSEDGWISEAISTWEGDSPRQLAQLLLEGGSRRPAAADDRTVVALKLTSREK